MMSLRHALNQLSSVTTRGAATRAFGTSLPVRTRSFTSDAEAEPQHTSALDTDLSMEMGPGEFGYPPKEFRPAAGTGRRRGIKDGYNRKHKRPSKGTRTRYAQIQRMHTVLRQRIKKEDVNFREAAAAIVYRAPVIERKRQPLEKKYQEYDAIHHPPIQPSDYVLYGNYIGDLNRPEQTMNTAERYVLSLRQAEEAAGPVNTTIRRTEADRINDLHDPGRVFDDYLFFIVKKDRQEHAWQFPQGTADPDEPLYETARREFKEEVGRSMKVNFGRQLPMGHYVYEHPPTREGHTGTKLWFYRGFWLKGRPRLKKDEGLVDFAWVPRHALKDYFSDEYYQFVEPLLPRLMGDGDQLA